MTEKQRTVHLSAHLWNSLVKRFEVLSGKEFASKVFVFAAYKGTKERLPEGDAGAFLKKEIESTTGGKVTKLEISKDTGGTVQVHDSAEADMYGPSETGVCYLTQGMIKAAAEKITGKPVNVQERKCRAKGDDYCEFAVIVGQ